VEHSEAFADITTPSKSETIRRVAGDLEITDLIPEYPKDEVPVILLSGWGETPITHKDSLQTIKKTGRRAIAIRTPRLGGVKSEDGYPKAEYNKARALIDTLNKKEIREVDIIAHSEGSIPAIIAAELFPERIRSIIFVEPAGLMDKDSRVKLALRFCTMLAKDAGRFLQGTKAEKANLFRASGEALKYFASNPKRAIEEAGTIASADIYNLLEKIEELGVKVSIIQSTEDTIFPMDKVLKTAKEKRRVATIGFYSVKGDHREISVHPEKYTALAVNALEDLNNSANNP